jgi:hypothetical protein
MEEGEMKRYWAHIIMSDNGERWEGDVMIAEEVDAVVLKLNEIINTGIGNQLNDKYKMDKLNEEIARLKERIERIEFVADSITVENEETAKVIKGIAREALEGKCTPIQT